MLDDGFSFEKHLAEIRNLTANGWHEAPSWFPVGLPGYEWEYVDCLTAMMRPAPRFLDRVRYQIPSFWKYRVRKI